MSLYDSIVHTIGDTPIVKLHRFPPAHVTLYAKVESFNPGGSVKDRLALAVILDAEQRGELKPGQTVVEATSGNTGVALAMVCAARGYPFVAVMSDSFSIERRKLMRAYGARVILTPAAERARGMVRKAEELAKRHGWFLTRQFDNEANPAWHRNTTGPEILRDFAGQRLDYFVSGWGTGGTLTGAGEMLKRARPDLKVIATEPVNASLLAGGEWHSHKIQGWTPDFLPKVLSRTIADEIIPIDEVLARDTARRLAQEEGIFCGISSGATVAAALEAARQAPQGSVLLAMLPDTGERYLSTFLFEGVNEGSDDDWLNQQG
jgi:cysteine synthase A